MSVDDAALPPLRRPEFRNLLGVSVTVALGFGMVIPILPLFARSFGVGLAAVGLVQLAFGLARFVSNLAAGLAVDRFGERASTIAGLLIVSLSSYGAGAAQSFWQLVAARGIGGAGSALFMAGLMNRILRIVEPEMMGRATGAFRSSFLVGIAAGPFLGGIVATRFGRAAPLHFYATGLLVAAVVAWIAMRGPVVRRATERRSPMEALRAAAPLVHDVRYAVALLATFVGWWSLAAVQNIGAVLALERLGFSEDLVGLATTLLAVGEIGVLLVAGRVADRRGRRIVLLPSLAVAALATAALGHVEGEPALYFVFMMLVGAGVSAGGVAAGGLLADAIPREGSGTAVGVNQMAGDLGYLLAPFLIGALADGPGFPVAFLVAALPAAFVFVRALQLPRRSHAPGRPAVEPSEPVG
ncbi:MAG TPA: MFS transporter [Actinomycetota bacterium]|nr:MFS transporter [Actinomycetota bacterium]